MCRHCFIFLQMLPSPKYGIAEHWCISEIIKQWIGLHPFRDKSWVYMGFAISFYPLSSSTSSLVSSQDPCRLFSGWLVKKPVHLGTGVGAKMAHLMTGSTNSFSAHPSTCPGRTHFRPAVRHCVSDEEQDQHRRETREVESKKLQAGDISILPAWRLDFLPQDPLHS